jgi:hypothetical protein
MQEANKRPFIENDKVERLLSVYEILETHSPVNRSSPMLLVAPRALHLQWKYALREVRKLWKANHIRVRSVEVIDLPAFDSRISTLEIQHIFVVDDVDPLMYKPLKLALQKLNPELQHRLFMVKVKK